MPLVVQVGAGTAAIVALAYAIVLGRRASAKRDRIWERSWKAIAVRDRYRISKVVENGEVLDDPREARLAVGAARQLAHVFQPQGTMLSLLGVAIAMVGLANAILVVVVFGLCFTGLGFSIRKRQMEKLPKLHAAERGNLQVAEGRRPLAQ